MAKITTILFTLLLTYITPASAFRPTAEDRYTQDDSTSKQSTQQKMTYQTTGDVLEMSPGEIINIKPLDFPRRGMSMRQVLDKLGKPKKTPAAVGNPPIRLWIYDDRTIYFEQMTVIHVVATH